MKTKWIAVFILICVLLFSCFDGNYIIRQITDPLYNRPFSVTVINGTGGGEFWDGETVTITADTISGKVFKNWTVNSGGVTLANASSETTTFTMTKNDVRVTANFDVFVDPSAKAITSFTINGVSGVINEAAKTISVLLPFGTDVTALTPAITHTGASISPASGSEQDFTTPVTYTVTAADGSTADYTVTVTVAPPGTYIVTVNGGTTQNGVYSYLPGETVTITANTPPAGYKFTDWSIVSGSISLTPDNTTATVTFTMPSTAVEVTANFAELVNAQTPTNNTISGGGSVPINSTVTLTSNANVTDGGTLSYQWYSNNTNSNSGGTAVGTNSNTYTPPTATAGTTYYYVVVTNTNTSVNGTQTASVTSNTVTVEVNPPGPTVIVVQGINETPYLNLQSALNAIRASVGTFTVKILGNQTLSSVSLNGSAMGTNNITLIAEPTSKEVIVEVSGSITVGIFSNFTLDSGVTLQRSPGNTGTIIAMQGTTASATFEMKTGSKITGNTSIGTGVSLSGSDTFNMNGGTIEGNNIGISALRGTVNISSGTIQGNTTGIIASSSTSSAGGYINMSGGKIQGNNTGIEVICNQFSGVGGSLRVSGSAVIKDNTEKNVVLTYSDITLGTPNPDMEIYVSSTGVIVSSGASTIPNVVDYFYTDIVGGTVILDGDRLRIVVSP